MTKRALVVEDHPIVRDVIVSSLSSFGIFQNVVTASSLQETLGVLAEDDGFALIILDLHLSDTVGTEGMSTLRESYPDIPIVIFSGEDSTDTISKAFEYGVRGYIPKSSSMAIVISAIKVVLAGSSYIPPHAIRMFGFEPLQATEVISEGPKNAVSLSPKQSAVFAELLNGVPNKVIALRLNMAEGTVKTHLHTIYQVLKVRSRAQAILKARDLNLL
ncbi:MAG: DNA-binding NarL/FixJ family response regulator [Candidatus Azotimanducaceae bacterium]